MRVVETHPESLKQRGDCKIVEWMLFDEGGAVEIRVHDDRRNKNGLITVKPSLVETREDCSTGSHIMIRSRTLVLGA